MLQPVLQQLQLSEPQRRAATAQGADVVVTAGAGTGKTRTLVGRFLALIATGTELRGIVAVTFTRKAAREMRNRVRADMRALLEQDLWDDQEQTWWQNQYEQLDAARIGTIHQLCGEILRAHPAEAALDPRFAVLDEAQSALLRAEAVEAALSWAADDPLAVKLFAFLSERDLKKTLDTLLQKRLDVQEALTLPNGGSSPADWLSHWETTLQRHQQAALDNFLNDPDVKEQRHVLQEAEPVKPNDRRVLQREAVVAAFAQSRSGNIKDRVDSLGALSDINLIGGTQSAWADGKSEADAVKEALRRLRDLWRAQKLLQLRLNGQDEQLAAAMPALDKLFQQALARYDAAKAAREAQDFDDLEHKAIQLLQKHAAVRAYWQRVVQALLVDEFQDTNERQLTLFRLLCPEAGKLFIVGDAKQSIYRFRGADVTVFSKERAAIAAAGGRVIDLQDSYRCHPHLLSGLNAVLAPVLGPPTPERPPWEAPFEPLLPTAREPLEGLAPPYIELHLTIGNKSEGAADHAANMIAQRLQQLVATTGIEWGDVAILCRGSNAFRAYEDALDRAGIRYMTVAGKGFYERPEIRDVLNALRTIADPTDDLALAGLLRSPAFCFTDGELYRLVQARPEGGSLWEALKQFQPDTADAEHRCCAAVLAIDTLHAWAGRTGIADVLKRFLDLTNYLALLQHAGLQRAARNVDKLLTDAHNSGLVSVEAFLEYVEGLRDSGSREGEARATGGGAVQIMTIHAAKGLEFPVVVLGDAGTQLRNRPGLLVDESLGVLLPEKDDDGDKAAVYQLAAELDAQQEEAEARRLLYVAFTRAKQLLLVNGNFKLNTKLTASVRGWLKRIGPIVGLDGCDFTGYDKDGSGTLSYDHLRVGPSALHLEVYEPGVPPPPPLPPSEPATDIPLPLPPPLLRPIARPIPPLVTTEDDEALIIRPVVGDGAHSTALSYVAGRVVHDAIARWRFDGDGLAGWLAARAREHGLSEERTVRRAVDTATTLLQRFRRHRLFAEMDEAARRHHELPFHVHVDGTLVSGLIDVLYLYKNRWTVVDFKTDHIRGPELSKRVEKHTPQIQRYGRAVKQLLGVEPRLMLCFLDANREINVASVRMEMAW